MVNRRQELPGGVNKIVQFFDAKTDIRDVCLVAINQIFAFYFSIDLENKEYILLNIAGRLPENSRNSFVDLQSQKTVRQ